MWTKRLRQEHAAFPRQRLLAIYPGSVFIDVKYRAPADGWGICSKMTICSNGVTTQAVPLGPEIQGRRRRKRWKKCVMLKAYG